MGVVLCTVPTVSEVSCWVSPCFLMVLLLGTGCCCNDIRNNEKPITHKHRTREKFQVTFVPTIETCTTQVRVSMGWVLDLRIWGFISALWWRSRKPFRTEEHWLRGPHIQDDMEDQGRRFHDFFDKQIDSFYWMYCNCCHRLVLNILSKAEVEEFRARHLKFLLNHNVMEKSRTKSFGSSVR